MCPNFVGSDSKSLTSYQKILWICSLGYENLLNLSWYIKKFHNCKHTNEDICRQSSWMELMQRPLKTILDRFLLAFPSLSSYDVLWRSARWKNTHYNVSISRFLKSYEYFESDQFTMRFYLSLMAFFHLIWQNFSI